MADCQKVPAVQFAKVQAKKVTGFFNQFRPTAGNNGIYQARNFMIIAHKMIHAFNNRQYSQVQLFEVKWARELRDKLHLSLYMEEEKEFVFLTPYSNFDEQWQRVKDVYQQKINSGKSRGRWIETLLKSLQEFSKEPTSDF